MSATTTTPELRLTPCPSCAVQSGPGYCLTCRGDGYLEVSGDLGPTRASPQGRPFWYMPGGGWLTLKRRGKPTVYRVREFAHQFEGRAFGVRKVFDGATYHVLCDRSGVSCDCAGGTYTAGCCHADAVRVLLAAGLFDLPTNPTE